MFAIDGITNLLSTVVNKIFPDANQAAEAKLKILEMQNSGELAALAAETDLIKGQLEINKTEAANASVFVAGWRPAIGWVCTAALAYQYVLCPIGVWACSIAGHPIPIPPSLDGNLYELMFGMLGIGGLRTLEKIKGVAK